MFSNNHIYFGYKKFLKEKINHKNFYFNLYDLFFYENIKKEKITKKYLIKVLNKTLYESSKIPYREREPETILLSFSNLFDIYFIHEAYRIKCSINSSENEWKKYIDFMQENNIFNKYPSNIISKDCINYLNFMKNNSDLKINFIKFDNEKDLCVNECEYCKVSLKDENNIINDVNYIYCNNCGMIIENVIYSNDNAYEDLNENFSTTYTISKNDLEQPKENTNKKFSLVDLNNFSKRLIYFQGKQKIKPPDIIIENLRNFLDSNKNKYLNGKTCDQIKELKTNTQKRKYITINSFEKLFKETKDTLYVKDIEYIAHVLFGWNLEDLSEEQQKEILKKYIQVQEIYNNIKKRDSNLNINIRLIFHLSLIGILINKNDIKMIKSKDSINYHIESFKEIANVMKVDIKPFLNLFE